jgi:O-acetyl-ADP-ribose deacetylase (regulator of RNase III)
LAAQHGITSIAFPAISCGIYGYPIPEAARIAVQTSAASLQTTPSLTTVIFACFGDDVLRAYEAALRETG